MKKITLLIVLLLNFSLYESMGQCGNISLVGEFNDWGNGGDHWMTQFPSNPDLWVTVLTLTNDMDLFGAPDIIEMKFRQDGSWAVNWGAPDFPSGVGYQDGPNIPVPINLAVDKDVYAVVFNCQTGDYLFEPCGPISLIGEFTGWAGDHFLDQDPLQPWIWTTTLVLNAGMNQYPPLEIIEMKFRHKSNWDVNWGATDFPQGVGQFFGPNIPVQIDPNIPQDIYKVTFDCSTGEYTFEPLVEVPLAPWAIGLGIILILILAIARYRNF